MKQLYWAFTLCVASIASAEENVKLLPAPLELPARIGPLQFDGKPHQYEPAALGVSYQYNGVGLSLTVYVYDAGVRDIPDGGDTVANCHLFEQTKREIGGAGYSDVRLVSEQLVRLSPHDDAPLAREAVFEFVRAGQSTLSYVWITSVAKHFVKVRFSMGTNHRHESEAARRVLLRALGDAVKPHLAPAPTDAGGSGVTLNMFAGAGRDEMAASIMYLTRLATRVDEVSGSRPVCGGEFVPPYEAELSAFRALLTLNLQNIEGEFGKQLAAVSDAGFLEEYVWMERHRDTWGNLLPPDLTLPEYQAWRKEKLTRVQPARLGVVIFNRPRPMQMEAPPAGFDSNATLSK